MAGEAGHVATVREQDGDSVVVAIPMVGFPHGFRLRPGDKVMVINDEEGPSARPLVKVVPAEGNDPERGSEVTSGGRRFAVSDAAVRLGGEGARHIAFVVEREADDGEEQVIAIRPLA